MGSRMSEALRKGVGGMCLVVQSGFWYASGRSDDEPPSCLVAEASGQRSQATAPCHMSMPATVPKS